VSLRQPALTDLADWTASEPTGTAVRICGVVDSPPVVPLGDQVPQSVPTPPRTYIGTMATHIDAWTPISCRCMAAVVRNRREMTNVIAMSSSHTLG